MFFFNAYIVYISCNKMYIMKYVRLLFVLLAIKFSYGQKFTGKFDRISYLSGNLQHDFKVSKLKLKEVITKNG